MSFKVANMHYLRTLIFFALICFSFSIDPICAEESVRPTMPIPVGEKLVYKISWLGIPVGWGEIWAKEKIQLNGREVIHIIGKVETNRVLSKIFPMHDEAHSWIDAKTFESLQFEKKINELLIKAHERMTFDARKKKGHYESFKTGLKKEFPIQTPVHDVFSAFYWVRRQTLVTEKPAQLVLTCDQKDWALTVRVIRREMIKLRGEKINTLRVEPSSIVEGVEKKNMAWFNLSDDAAQIPLKLTYKAPFGNIVGILESNAS